MYMYMYILEKKNFTTLPCITFKQDSHKKELELTIVKENKKGVKNKFCLNGRVN